MPHPPETPYPKVQLLPDQDRRLRAGHPWAYSNELRMDAAAKALRPGAPVCLLTADGRRLALAQFNPHSLIAARLLDPQHRRDDRCDLSRAAPGAGLASA